MDPIAVGLVLVAAVFHAGWNRLLHGQQDRVPAMAVSGFTIFVVLLPDIVLHPPTAVWPLVLASGVMEVIYVGFLTSAYRHGALSLAYPIGRGTAPLLVTLGAWIVLRQTPTPTALAGALALGAGLAVVGIRGQAQVRRVAVTFALLTGAAIATYSLIDSQAVRHSSPAAYLGLVMGVQCLMLGTWLRGDVTRLRAALRPGMLIGLGSIGSYLLVLIAFQRASPGPVATLREVSVLLALLISGERPGRWVWSGGVLVVLGAVLVAV